MPHICSIFHGRPELSNGMERCLWLIGAPFARGIESAFCVTAELFFKKNSHLLHALKSRNSCEHCLNVLMRSLL